MSADSRPRGDYPSDGVGVVTIDGPAASGKSTVARLVAQRLGIPFVSSGLLYRGATYIALQEDSDLGDEAGLLAALNARDVALVPLTDGNRLLVDGGDVTSKLQTDQVDLAVSTVATHPGVRSWVNARLREIESPFVVEGRDMGTVVFPGARHKYYLTAPAEVRARRRQGERSADLQSITTALQRRDEQDAGRLGRAQDATAIDTGDLSLDEVVSEVLQSIPRDER